jgi:hypothetical protein
MEQNVGISRRRLLQRGAAAGAVAWTAPLVLAHPASAAPVCTPAALPSVVPGTPVPSFTCSGNGIRRRISYRVDIPAPQVACPAGGNPVITSASCTSSLGACLTNPDGSFTWTYDSPGRGRDATVEFRLVLSVSCDSSGCAVTCTTASTVVFDVQDNGNCRITTRVLQGTTTCVPS